MHFTSHQVLDDGLAERHFTLGEIPGILWTPGTVTAPLILLGHPGGLDGMYPRLLGRARSSAALGFASATIELPGSGSRPGLPVCRRRPSRPASRRDGGKPVGDDIVDRLITPLIEQSVPVMVGRLLDALPDIDGPVGYSGGILAIGVRLG